METIIEAGVLTLQKAKQLLNSGQKVICTSEEYKGNTPHIREFVISAIISDWDRAAEMNSPYLEFQTRQEYWQSFLKPEQIKAAKESYLIQIAEIDFDNGGLKTLPYHCSLNNPNFEEPTFYGSDADRPVYFTIS